MPDARSWMRRSSISAAAAGATSRFSASSFARCASCARTSFTRTFTPDSTRAASRRCARVPSIVLTLHGDEPGGALRWNVDRMLHARTKRFIVFTGAQRLRFAAEQRVALERIAVIPNGVVRPQPAASRAALRAQLGIPDDAFAVYSVGRLAPEKNQAAALDAIASLARRGMHDIHLVVAGTGPLASALQARADALGIPERVHYLGHRDDAPELAFAMDAFLHASLRERMPLALGEAMLAGLAPIVTPWAGSDDMIRAGSNGLIAGGFDGESIAAAITEAYRDRERLARIAARAAQDALAVFDVTAMVRAHVDLYSSLTEGIAR
jgi:glycosyltransferase involved in cell wall biosynthesis